MSKDYFKIAKEVAVEILTKKGKTISEKIFIVALIASLKKKLGKLDKRHTSKSRFRSETFRVIIKTKDWRNDIIQINDGKFSLTSWLKTLPETEVDSDYDWKNIGIEEAKFKTLNLLKKLDNYKFEELVKIVIEKNYPGFSAFTTSKTGDGGIDVKATMPSIMHEGKNIALFAQAKKFKGSVDSPHARTFIGSVNKFHINQKWEAFHALFVTTGKFTNGFIKDLKESDMTGVNFDYWDREKLTDKLFQYGLGMTFTINTEFWDDLDFKLIPKSLEIEKTI